MLQSRLQSVIGFMAVCHRHPYIHSSSHSPPGCLTSAYCPAPTKPLPASRGRCCRVLARFSCWYFVLKYHTEQLPSKPVGQPRVLDDSHLEALTAEHSVVVGVDGSAHALDDHQVSLPLTDHHCQHFVQATGQGKIIMFAVNIIKASLVLQTDILS